MAIPGLETTRPNATLGFADLTGAATLAAPSCNNPILLPKIILWAGRVWMNCLRREPSKR